ncbi:nitroreductase family protein [Nocardioides sp. KR10-350]|uniref:nitroreductase family protein n=1 Tax=Nocardioides cheoyonin TaxID=3156615 RepID=UPI0032B3DEF5
MTDLQRAPMPGAEELTDYLRDRWSVSVFDDSHALDDGEISVLLKAAQWAPSAGNSQPWAFVVATRGSAAHEVLVKHLSRGNSGWVPRASAVFITVAQVAPDSEGNGPKWPTYSYYDLGQAAAHLTVQAAAMGLASHQFAGFDHDAVAAELGVPEWWQVMTGIAIGVRGNPADVDPRDAEREQRERVRKPLSQVAFGARWGEAWEG